MRRARNAAIEHARDDPTERNLRIPKLNEVPDHDDGPLRNLWREKREGLIGEMHDTVVRKRQEPSGNHPEHRLPSRHTRERSNDLAVPFDR